MSSAETEPTSVPLYANRVKVYPKSVSGSVRRVKWAVLGFCLAVYYFAPWLRWDRGEGRPSQAFLIDMPARKGYFLWLEIWPQDIWLIAGLLILGAILLFFVTSLFGRLWCGYACPQTVWTDLFLLTERWIEGDRTQRMRLDAEKWSARKLTLKVAKHSVWLLIAAATGGAWVMYFNDAPTLALDLVHLDVSPTVLGFAGLFTATTYTLAGWAREQVCTYMCPWPRFQSAMVDENTLTVLYRDWRGETRGKHKKGESWEGRGDCVDCRACVAVCPTGIDIRDGLQMECIGCGLCIDACDDIMTKVDRPIGLIAFDTAINQQARRHGGEPARWRLVRPRTIVYASVLAAVAGVLLVGLVLRETLDVNVLADRSPLFVRLSDGGVRNAYTVKLLNKTPDPRAFNITVTGAKSARMAIAGVTEGELPAEFGAIVTVKPDSVGAFRVLLHVPADQVRPEIPLTVSVTEMRTGEHVTRSEIFHGPN